MSNLPSSPHTDAGEPLVTAKLGIDRNLIQLHSHVENSQALSILCGQAKQKIHMYCHTISPLIYDDTALIEAIEQFALSSSKARIHILVEDTLSVIKNCNRLLSLSHRLSSRIEIRKTHHEFIDRFDEFVTLDGTAYFRRPNAEHYAATCCFNARGTTKELDVFFETAWEHSQTDPELRNMVM